MKQQPVPAGRCEGCDAGCMALPGICMLLLLCMLHGGWMICRHVTGVEMSDMSVVLNAKRVQGYPSPVTRTRTCVSVCAFGLFGNTALTLTVQYMGLQWGALYTRTSADEEGRLMFLTCIQCIC
jgi:hypothetical protein